MAKKKSKRRKASKKKTGKRRKSVVGKACRRANMTITRRKRDYIEALSKIKSLKKQLSIAEKSATKKRNEVLKAQKRAKDICSG